MATRLNPNLIEQSPFAAILGLKLESAADGQSRVRLPFKPELLNKRGPIHGGAIATLIDSTALAALLTEPVNETATISLNVTYLNAAIERDLLAVGRIRKKGRAIATMFVEVSDTAGTHIADGMVTFRIYTGDATSKLGVSA